MWNCGFGRFYPAMGGFGGGLIWVLLGALILAGILYAAVKILNRIAANRSGTASDRIDSLQILKIRYARGEISEAEFLKMKELLS
jgi:putative membrane protein